MWINGITFTVPLYSVLGYFTGGGYNNPIPVGNLTYTIEEMAQTHPPLNIVGYQINPNQCLDCPYSPTLIGTRSKYNYTPQQQIFFDNQMKGDTAKIMIEARFGEMSDEIIETVASDSHKCVRNAFTQAMLTENGLIISQTNLWLVTISCLAKLEVAVLVGPSVSK